MVYINESFFRELKELEEDFRNDAHKVKWAIDKTVLGYALVALGEAQGMSRGLVDPTQSRSHATLVPRTGVRMARSNLLHTKVGLIVGASPLMTRGAWTIPVRRITQDYYHGWKHKKLGNARYMVYNASREAYFIEFGINHQATGLVGSNGVRVRVRRPVMKLAVIKALNFARATHFDMNIISQTFAKSSGMYHSPDLLPYNKVSN